MSEWHLAEKLYYIVLAVLKPLFEAVYPGEAHIFNVDYIEVEI
jgi:hypothetical protein